VLRNKQRGDDEPTARQAATLAKGAAAAGNWRRRVTMVDARDLEFLAGVERPRRLRAEENTIRQFIDTVLLVYPSFLTTSQLAAMQAPPNTHHLKHLSICPTPPTKRLIPPAAVFRRPPVFVTLTH